MKKTLLLVICLAFTLTLFVISVSAAEYDFGTMAAPITTIPQNHIFGDEDHGSGLHHDGWYLSKDGVTLNTDVARVKLTYNGKTVVYPTYYILKNDSTLNWDFAPVSAHLGVELNVDNIVAIEIPYGITEVPRLAFALPNAFVSPEDTARYEEDGKEQADHPQGYVGTPNTTLEYVFISNTVLRIKDFAFAHCTSLATFDSIRHTEEEGMTGNHDHQMLQSVGYRAFHDCEELTDFNFNNHLVSLGEGAFQGCSLKAINLSKCIELKEIPAYCFHESNAGSIDEIILSNSVEIIGDYAFTGAQASHVFLGTDVKVIGHGAIDMKKAEYLILPKSLVTIYEDSIAVNAQSYVAVIVGAKDQADVAATLAVLDAAGLDIKHGDKPNKIWDNTESFFADTNPSFCEAYLGGHTVDHDSETVKSVSYPNGIAHKGYAMGSCGVCNQMLNTQVEISPIIIAKGFSICTYNGLNAFTNGFEVYHDALKLYETIYGECELGIVFLLDQLYAPSKDLHNDISTMGVRIQYLAAGDTLEIVTMDYVMTYSKGLTYEQTDANGNVVTDENGDPVIIDRGSVPVIIAAYMFHTDGTKAGSLANTSHYVQDTDDICLAGTTSDGKYVTASYNSIYGYLRSMSEEEAPAMEINN